MGHYVQFEAEGPGIYVVVSTPRVERVEIPVDGVLHNTKLSKQISLRFPKKATDTDMVCNVQVSVLCDYLFFGHLLTSLEHQSLT